MAENYDPVLDLGHLVVTGLNYRNDTYYWASRIAERLSIGEDDYAETVAEVLRKALSLSGTCEAVPTATGIPCGQAAARYSGTCGCGHPRDGWLCEGCRAKSLWCRTCYRLGRGGAHECAVTLPPAGALARAVAPGRVSG